MNVDSTMPRFADHALHADGVVEAAINAVDPGKAVRTAWLSAVGIHIGNGPLKVLAVGKASLEMVRAACDCVKSSHGVIDLRGGVVTAVPERLSPEIVAELARSDVQAFPADHPLPTHRNLVASREVAAFLKQSLPEETLLVLLSGGGSAHLASPGPGLSLEELAAFSSDLMKAGATIAELNTVRKHLERLKGGRSAALCNAGRIVVLVLSDVIGDPLDVIASGPFAPDPTTFADAWRVIERRLSPQKGTHEAAVFIIVMGKHKTSLAMSETPKPGDPVFRKVTHAVIANNSIAVSAIGEHLRRGGFDVVGVHANVEGEAAEVAQDWISSCLGNPATTGPVAFLLGGETTVTVGAATGLGGPSQEFALVGARALAMYRAAHPNSSTRFALVTFSTDGIDGPTDAAGAIVTDETWRDITRTGIDPAAALANHDSHRALDRVGALIRTGPTGTNVNHIAVLMVYPK